ncbi:hypothetical protein K438DRAFT_1957497 [Mycena galopus ATCC 62051]|nr:hypothetical protein K438DRAFT_1957497 [Mycena galopus ATCC 62051]
MSNRVNGGGGAPMSGTGQHGPGARGGCSKTSSTNMTSDPNSKWAVLARAKSEFEHFLLDNAFPDEDHATSDAKESFEQALAAFETESEILEEDVALKVKVVAAECAAFRRDLKQAQRRELCASDLPAINPTTGAQDTNKK